MIRMATLMVLIGVSCSKQGGPDPRQLAFSVEPLPSASAEQIAEGQKVFLEGSCAMCHSIRGTRAKASVGPDLTHLASRKSIASGSFANTRGHLAGWILNPQNMKPGSLMPPTSLAAKDLHSLLSFLESLN